MAVELRCDASHGREYADALLADARRAMRAAGVEHAELSIAIVNDRAMRELNRDWLDRDEPTDVLAFSQLEVKNAPPLSPRTAAARAAAKDAILGDIVISIDTAARQARDARIPTGERLRELLVHGLVHLLGYDHERSPADERRMIAREDEILAQLGGAKGPRRRGAPR